MVIFLVQIDNLIIIVRTVSVTNLLRQYTHLQVYYKQSSLNRQYLVQKSYQCLQFSSLAGSDEQLFQFLLTSSTYFSNIDVVTMSPVFQSFLMLLSTKFLVLDSLLFVTLPSIVTGLSRQQLHKIDFSFIFQKLGSFQVLKYLSIY